jgi:hypothetical protein
VSKDPASGQSTPLACLWKENPNRLVSWWDMTLHALKMLKGIELMARMQTLSLLGRDAVPSPLFHEECARVYDDLAESLRELGLLRQSERTTSIAEFVRSHQKLPDESSIQNLVLLIHHDLDAFVFEAVPQERTQFYESNHLFGDEVHDKFFSTAYDLREAGNCYALGRNTACVFHLMRVLEIGLKALAKQFNVPSDHANWGNVIDGIEKAVRELDKDPARPANWKDDREFYSQCASHFVFVKDGWRNYTDHARGKYDEQEALDQLVNVRSFMQKLATRLHE